MTKIGSRTVLLIALVAAIIGGVATYSVSALTSTAKTEVRITAQRVDDGRVEFALQQREDDGKWSERMLPSRRFFPAEGFVNRWATSTPLEIDSGIPFYVNTTQPKRSFTIEEYLKVCRTDAAKFLAEGLIDESEATRLEAVRPLDDEKATWEDAFHRFDVVLTARMAIDPPGELAEYHQSQVSIMSLAAQYAFAQPPDAKYGLEGHFGFGFLVFGLAEEGKASLDPVLRQRLVDTGCIDDEEASQDN